MIGCFDFIFSVCICLNKMRCQFFIGGKKVGLFAMTEQQHLSSLYTSCMHGFCPSRCLIIYLSLIKKKKKTINCCCSSGCFCLMKNSLAVFVDDTFAGLQLNMEPS